MTATTLPQASIAEVAAHYGITTAEVEELLGRQKQQKITQALQNLREAITKRLPGHIVTLPEGAERMVALAVDHLTEVHAALSDLIAVSGVNYGQTPTSLLQAKVRSLESRVQRVSMAIAAIAADPKLARQWRTTREAMPELANALEGIGVTML